MLWGSQFNLRSSSVQTVRLTGTSKIGVLAQHTLEDVAEPNAFACGCCVSRIVTGGSTLDVYTSQQMSFAEKCCTMPGELTAAIHNSQYNSILTISKTAVLSWDAAQGQVLRVSCMAVLYETSAFPSQPVVV